MFRHARGDSQDIRIKNNIFRRNAGLVDQQVIGPPADFEAAFGTVRLALLVKGHNHDSGAIAPD